VLAPVLACFGPSGCRDRLQKIVTFFGIALEPVEVPGQRSQSLGQHAPLRLAGAPRGGKSSAVLGSGQSVGTQTAMSRLSLVIPPVPGLERQFFFLLLIGLNELIWPLCRGQRIAVLVSICAQQSAAAPASPESRPSRPSSPGRRGRASSRVPVPVVVNAPGTTHLFPAPPADRAPNIGLLWCSKIHKWLVRRGCARREIL
jgi:hypothetical protein